MNWNQTLNLKTINEDKKQEFSSLFRLTEPMLTDRKDDRLNSTRRLTLKESD